MAEQGRVHRLRPLESDAQATIVELAEWKRWRVYHTRDSRGSHAGYPDLTLVRDRIVFVELKRVGEKPRREQVAWLDALAAGGGEVYVWTLDDLHEIGRILDRPSPRFVPLGEVVTVGGSQLNGPRLVTADGRVSFAPRSAWIPGTGRRDAA